MRLTNIVARCPSLALFLSVTALISSCGEKSERPETITKLRAVGVEQSPVNAKIGDSVQLTFYTIAKPQAQITATVLTDGDARYSVPIEVQPQDSAPVETNVGALSLYSYRATLTVPGSTAVLASLTRQGWARLRYQVKFSSDQEEENVVGDTLVYPENAPQLSWTAPVIAITKPEASGSSGTLDLEGSINGSGEETNRVSWFVSSGKVKNRRAKSSQWQDAEPGTQSVFLTVRGTKSGAFAIKALSVVLN